jgi:hypothetical protein
MRTSLAGVETTPGAKTSTAASVRIEDPALAADTTAARIPDAAALGTIRMAGVWRKRASGAMATGAAAHIAKMLPCDSRAI